MGEARRRKLLGQTEPKDPKRKYREKKPSNVAKVLVYGKKYNPMYGR
jgi:hypothetical protein